ncbi:MAG: AAA family ATPase, partial [Thermodesulfatator sp.]
MRRLPLDTSSFRQIRESGDVYVDKTPWIYRLLAGGRCYFLSRPRRFGKSLTVNTLKELFRGNRKLFEGLYIHDKWDFREHPVLIFDFNEISHETPQELKKALHERLERYASLYGVASPEETLRGKFESL